MIPVIRYDPKFKPSEEVLRKLERSLEEIEEMKEQDLKCPICGFRIMGVYSDKSGHANVKCRKCKFSGPINLSYFRTQKKYSHYRWHNPTSKRMVR